MQSVTESGDPATDRQQKKNDGIYMEYIQCGSWQVSGLPPSGSASRKVSESRLRQGGYQRQLDRYKLPEIGDIAVVEVHKRDLRCLADVGAERMADSVTNTMTNMRKEFSLDDLVTLDLRRTVRTRMASLDVSREISARCLNHVDEFERGAHDEVYNRDEYFEEKLDAFTRWERAGCTQAREKRMEKTPRRWSAGES